MCVCGCGWILASLVYIDTQVTSKVSFWELTVKPAITDFIFLMATWGQQRGSNFDQVYMHTIFQLLTGILKSSGKAASLANTLPL